MEGIREIPEPVELCHKIKNKTEEKNFKIIIIILKKKRKIESRRQMLSTTSSFPKCPWHPGLSRPNPWARNLMWVSTWVVGAQLRESPSLPHRVFLSRTRSRDPEPGIKLSYSKMAHWGLQLCLNCLAKCLPQNRTFVIHLACLCNYAGFCTLKVCVTMEQKQV